jgi:hypothetical protein
MAINGRGLFTRPDGREFSFGLDLDLDALGIIRICFGGFFTGLIHFSMGFDSKLDWRSHVADPKWSVADLLIKALSNPSFHSEFRKLYRSYLASMFLPLPKPSNRPFSAQPHFYDSNLKKPIPLVRNYVSNKRLEEEIKFKKEKDFFNPAVEYTLKISIKDR